MQIDTYNGGEQRVVAHLCPLTPNMLEHEMAEPIIILEDGKAIHLSIGKYTIVDESDYNWLMQWKWNCNSQNYVERSAAMEERGDAKNGFHFRMHRVIMDAAAEMQVDHVNGYSLDNRRSNLRICTKRQNSHNRGPQRKGSSIYKGICKIKSSGRWQAKINALGVHYYLGCYSTEEEAARAYDRAALEHFGEFAWQNFPIDGQQRGQGSAIRILGKTQPEDYEP